MLLLLLQSRFSDVKLGLSASAAGYGLVHLETVSSTNTAAFELAIEGRSRIWVVSDTQTGGRGRHGRVWASPQGNLYASLLLIAPCAVADMPKLGFVAGLAVADVVRECDPHQRAMLKWPNDLMVGGAKLTGILLEGQNLPGGRQAVSIGIGINVAFMPEGTGRVVTSLHEMGLSIGRDDLFAAISDRMAYWLMVFAGGAGFPTICTEWLKRALPLKTAMSVKLPTGERHGNFAGIDDTGRLKLDTPDGLVHVEAGDVFLNDELPSGCTKDQENGC